MGGILDVYHVKTMAFTDLVYIRNMIMNKILFLYLNFLMGSSTIIKKNPIDFVLDKRFLVSKLPKACQGEHDMEQ